MVETAKELKRILQEAADKISAAEMAVMDAATAFDELRDRIDEITDALEVLQAK